GRVEPITPIIIAVIEHLLVTVTLLRFIEQGPEATVVRHRCVKAGLAVSVLQRNARAQGTIQSGIIIFLGYIPPQAVRAISSADFLVFPGCICAIVHVIGVDQFLGYAMGVPAGGG